MKMSKVGYSGQDDMRARAEREFPGINGKVHHEGMMAPKMATKYATIGTYKKGGHVRGRVKKGMGGPMGGNVPNQNVNNKMSDPTLGQSNATANRNNFQGPSWTWPSIQPQGNPLRKGGKVLGKSIKKAVGGNLVGGLGTTTPSYLSDPAYKADPTAYRKANNMGSGVYGANGQQQPLARNTGGRIGKSGTCGEAQQKAFGGKINGMSTVDRMAAARRPKASADEGNPLRKGGRVRKNIGGSLSYSDGRPFGAGPGGFEAMRGRMQGGNPIQRAVGGVGKMRLGMATPRGKQHMTSAPRKVNRGG
jgi:hypothetical protein